MDELGHIEGLCISVIHLIEVNNFLTAFIRSAFLSPRSLGVEKKGKQAVNKGIFMNNLIMYEVCMDFGQIFGMIWMWKTIIVDAVMNM